MSRAKKEPVEQVLHNDKTAAINAALASIDRAFGKGTMVRLGDTDPALRDIQMNSTSRQRARSGSTVARTLGS